MDSRTAGFAAKIVERAASGRRVDELLRAEMKRARWLCPSDAREAAGAVFNFFRWRGWLDDRMPLRRQIEQASDLALAFARNPKRFADEELLARAVPNWTRRVMDVSGAWVRAIQAEPVLWLRARPGEGAQLAEELRADRPFAACPETLRYDGEQDLFRTAAFHEGRLEIQDVSSQAVGWLCAPKAGETWWDACAGEGGKTLHLSDLMQNKGLIWATDRMEARLLRLKRRAGRARVFNYRTALWNGSDKLPSKTKFDGILVDAPCSGIGTWQRNSQTRWTTTPADVEELAEVQFNLLSRVVRSLKPGGKLIYSVCTLAARETSEIAERLQSAHPDLLPLAQSRPLSAPEERTQHWFWPQEYGGTGMFVAHWRRAEG